MNNWDDHLRVASGYLELDMVDEAAAEVENIAPEDKMRYEVLAFRVEVFRAAGNWDGMEAVSSFLAKVQPNEPSWPINQAWAERRRSSVAAARKILEVAQRQFPDNATILYNLSCYASVEGDIDEAKKYLKQAINRNKKFREISLDDPDLTLLWDSIETG